MKKIVRFAIGVLLIVLTAIIWVTSGYLIQLIFHSQGFNKPFFYTYFTTSLFSLYLSLFLCLPSFHRSILEFFSFSKYFRRTSPKKLEINNEENENDEIGKPKKEKSYYSIERVFSTSILIAPIWFLANYTYNIGLNYTSLSSSTIISSGSPMFGFIFSTLLRIENFSFVRLLCVISTLGGVILITLCDYWFPSEGSESDGGGTNPLLGNILSIIGSVLYGLYTTVLQKRVGEGEREKKYSITMMFGFVGIINFCGLLSILVLLSVTNFEPFIIPGWRTILTLFGNGIIGTVFSDLIWAFSVILTSSVSALIGLSLSIPLSLVVDLLDGNKKLDNVVKAILYILGTLFVCSGFITANISYFFSKKIRYYDEGKFIFYYLKNYFSKKIKISEKTEELDKNNDIKYMEVNEVESDIESEEDEVRMGIED